MKGKAIIATTRVPMALCPGCRRTITAATGASFGPHPKPPRPKPGDVTMCAYCGAVMMFDAEMIPRAATREEKQRILAENPEVRELWDMWLKRNDPTKRY